jgi:transposase InsO family protein
MHPLVSQGHLGSVTNESLDCTACQTAKQPALSFNKSTSISASSFDLVHSDIWGPAPTPTMGGSRYFVLFIDDYSRFTWIFMMKNRHELAQIYINFAKMIKTQFSKTIKVFRRDNAMEYRDSKILSFLGEQGTVSEFSCPYTSQQNGRAERKHRHILDSVRAMLISASCPERAWGEACLTLFTLLIVSPHLSLVMSPLLSVFITLQQIITHLRCSVVLVLFSFRPMNIPNLNLVRVFVVFLVMELNTKVIDVGTQYPSAFGFLAMLSFGNT